MDPTQSKRGSEDDDNHLENWLERELRKVPAVKLKTPMSTNLLIYKASLAKLTDKEIVQAFLNLEGEIDKATAKEILDDKTFNYIKEKILILIDEVKRRVITL